MSLLRGIFCTVALFAWAGAAIPRAEAAMTVEVCDGYVEFIYANPQNYHSLGDTVRPRLLLGAGLIQGGTHLAVNRVRFELDCQVSGVPCPDGGNLMSYVGNISSTCSTTWTADSAGGTLPNEIVFTASPPVLIPPSSYQFCELQFDVRVNAVDVTPTITEAAGFVVPANDAVCDTPGLLAVGSTSVNSIEICVCDDANPCTTDACDPQTGCLHANNPGPCDDGNVCTVNESCIDGSCQPGELPTGTPCDDGNACTSDDACLAGVCHGTITLPAQVNDSVAVTKQGTVTTVSWADDPGVFAVYRGIRTGDLGWDYNHTCFAGPASGQTAADGEAPPLGGSWYYLVTRRTACAESAPGQDSSGLSIPNPDPCP